MLGQGVGDSPAPLLDLCLLKKFQCVTHLEYQGHEMQWCETCSPAWVSVLGHVVREAAPPLPGAPGGRGGARV